jgi:hypothetical protein
MPPGPVSGGEQRQLEEQIERSAGNEAPEQLHRDLLIRAMRAARLAAEVSAAPCSMIGSW